jgi:hypothetical protein
MCFKCITSNTLFAKMLAIFQKITADISRSMQIHTAVHESNCHKREFNSYIFEKITKQ